MNQIDVSIVIVCMNNYRILKQCLNSIKDNTFRVEIETLLIAYFFSDENLNLLKAEYPWVKIIVSNEIRGFSANNNLGLNLAQGKYCFVLNDDTYFSTSVIDQLHESIQNIADAVLLSPMILTPNGSIQYSGIPPIDWVDWLMILFKLKKERIDKTGTYIRTTGVFKTYNILGAAFLIKTSIFRQMGFFDERYFFGPEDKALSTLLNHKGLACYVDSNVEIYHYGGATGGTQSSTVCATRPAERMGSVIFYANGDRRKKITLSCCVWLNSLIWGLLWMIKLLFWGDKKAKYSMKANFNVCRTIFSRKSTTEIFKQFYKRK